MAKVKLTKSELKAQRDDLKRFQRYLPTLQLKKQQLQMEVRRVRDEHAHIKAEEDKYRAQVDSWIGLLDETAAEELKALMEVEEFITGVNNIAGLDTPVFHSLKFKKIDYDLFETPIWFDDALTAVKRLVELQLHQIIVQEQLELIEKELRTTTQRVNLFEKVKIPESKENIRRIQIYLGDQQANAVGRAKIAKAKCKARDENAA